MVDVAIAPSTSGDPLPHASLDDWPNAATGLLWPVDPQQPKDPLHCRLRVAADAPAPRTA